VTKIETDVYPVIYLFIFLKKEYNIYYCNFTM